MIVQGWRVEGSLRSPYYRELAVSPRMGDQANIELLMWPNHERVLGRNHSHAEKQVGMQRKANGKQHCNHGGGGGESFFPTAFRMCQFADFIRAKNAKSATQPGLSYIYRTRRKRT